MTFERRVCPDLSIPLLSICTRGGTPTHAANCFTHPKTVPAESQQQPVYQWDKAA